MLSYDTRPDIAIAVEQLSKRNADPKIGYFTTTNQLI